MVYKNTEIYKKTFEILNKGFFNTLDFAKSQTTTTKELHNLAQTQGEVCADLRLAIQSFYNTHGFNAFVICNKKQKDLKIITNIKNNRQNLYVEILNRWLLSNKESFQASMNNKQLSGQDIEKMANFTLENLQISDESLAKDVIKSSIKQVFGFDERDGIFFRKLEMVFRVFDYEIVEINKTLREIEKSPYINLDPSTKTKLDRLCQNINFQALISSNTQALLHDQINLKLIDVPTFSKMVRFLCVSRLRISLHRILSVSGIDITQQIVYCRKKVQEYRSEILDMIANNLCSLLYNNTYNAGKFISFFDGENRESSGKVIKIPTIYDDGKSWSIQEIKEAVKQKLGSDDKIKELKDQLQSINEVLIGIDIDGYRNKIENKKTQIAELEKLQSSQVADLKNLSINKVSQKSQIDDASSVVHKTIEKKLELINEVEHLEKTIILSNDKKTNFTEQKSALESELKNIQSSFNELNEKYNKMLKALVKAIGRSIDIYSRVG